MVEKIRDATLVQPAAVITEITDLASDSDKADMILITHLKWHLLKFTSCKEAFVKSNDYDVVILLFYLKDLGLQNVWIHNGKGT